MGDFVTVGRIIDRPSIWLKVFHFSCLFINITFQRNNQKAPQMTRVYELCCAQMRMCFPLFYVNHPQSATVLKQIFYPVQMKDHHNERLYKGKKVTVPYAGWDR